jgi:glycosyltransferase EpsE
MQPQDKISIIMGIYNGEKTLKIAIESILTQTYSNWELIICDDASTDGTWQLISEYKASDPRIVLIKNDSNVGLAASLNKCLEKASGCYIARQDADDKSAPERLERQLAHMKAHPEIDVLSSSSFLCDSKFNVWGEHLLKAEIKKTDWAKGSQIIHASAIMKKSILLKHSGYDSSARRVEDYDLWLRILAGGGCIKTHLEKLYYIQWSSKDYIRKRKTDRFREIKYKLKGMRLNQMPMWSYVYLLKPLFLILLPSKLLYLFHLHRMKNNKSNQAPQSQ